jgi:flap endonuclease-1
LLGCDYCETIKGIGPKRAIDLVKEHKSIDKIIEKIDKEKYPIPENWLYKEARELFLNPEVIDANTIDLKWNEPDEDGVIEYMCKEKGFNEERMKNGIKKILKSRNTGTQARLDTFFKVTSVTPNKRKVKILILSSIISIILCIKIFKSIAFKTEESKEGEKKKAKKGAANFKKIR